MKQRSICIFIFIISLSLCFLPITATAQSPAATLTIDGMLVGTFSSVQAAVDEIDLNTGTNFIVEIAEGTVSDPLNILQLPGKNVVIRPRAGASVVFTNTITIDGNGNLNSPETLLIQGFTFEFSSGTYENCIYFNFITPRVGYCYPHNITINGCNFKGVFDRTVAVQSVPNGSRNIAIMNCTATDMHSLAQLKAVAGYAFIQNCTLSNSNGGVNFYGPGNLIIDSCKFDVVGYAVRSGQGSGVISNLGSVVINNSKLNSNSAEDGTIVLRGDSTNNINIVHSDIKNSNEDGAYLQNLNSGSHSLYDIDIVESNVTGSIMGINPSTITIIDDPNVKNGPVNINGNDEPDDLISLIRTLIRMVFVLLIVIVVFVISVIVMGILVVVAIINWIRNLV